MSNAIPSNTPVASLWTTDDQMWWSSVWTCSGRAAAAALMILGLLGLATRMLSDHAAWADAIKLAGGSLLATLVPGGLILLAWRPRQRFSMLEIGGLGIATGFGLAQLLTMVAMLLHRSSVQMLVVLCAIAAAHGAVAMRGKRRVTVAASRGELVLIGAILAVAAFAYLQGSPFTDTEDSVHIAIVRRFVYLQHPALDNIYYGRHIVYTYPFPGTHYVMALMAQAVALDPLFIYHKLRAFWFVVSMVMLYGFALAVFESRRVACASALVALAFVANGTFATVSGFFWGQLVPFSHASDVAMGALLPSLMVLAANCIKAGDRRERAFFLASTLALAFMLMVVHTREIVQFIVYLTAFALALSFVGDSHRLRWPVLVLLVSTIAGLAAYGVWHNSMGTMFDNVNTLMTQRRQLVVDILRSASWPALFGSPVPLLSQFIQTFGPMFYGWIPLVLLAGPAVLYRHRRHPLTLLVGASILSYLLIIRIPLLAIAYVWGTYFEVLFTPVRNVMLFVHMLAGVTVYAIAVHLARLRPVIGVGLALAVSAVAIGAFRFGDAAFARWNDLFFVPAILTYGYVAYRLWRVGGDPEPQNPDPGSRIPDRRVATLCTLIVLPLAIATRMPDSSPLGTRVAESTNTPATVLAEFECQDRRVMEIPFRPPELGSEERINVPAARSCPPTPAVIKFATEQISPDAVFAVDKFSMFPAPVFMPQQVVAWQSVKEEFLDEEQLFRDYFRYYRMSMVEYHAQPFFNDRESLEERIGFVRRLGVTHVLVGPWSQDMMTRALGRYPNLFHPIFENGNWTIYQVTRMRTSEDR